MTIYQPNWSLICSQFLSLTIVMFHKAAACTVLVSAGHCSMENTGWGSWRPPGTTQPSDTLYANFFHCVSVQRYLIRYCCWIVNIKALSDSTTAYVWRQLPWHLHFPWCPAHPFPTEGHKTALQLHDWWNHSKKCTNSKWHQIDSEKDTYEVWEQKREGRVPSCLTSVGKVHVRRQVWRSAHACAQPHM